MHIILPSSLHGTCSALDIDEVVWTGGLDELRCSGTFEIGLASFDRLTAELGVTAGTSKFAVESLLAAGSALSTGAKDAAQLAPASGASVTGEPVVTESPGLGKEKSRSSTVVHDVSARLATNISGRLAR
jgi:hypothetical protein